MTFEVDIKVFNSEYHFLTGSRLLRVVETLVRYLKEFAYIEGINNKLEYIVNNK